MTRLYVANCSKYVQDFLYRLPGQSQTYRVTIQMGGQAIVHKDASKEDLQYIVDQHEKYGLVHVGEIDRTKDFRGLCYQWDVPVQIEKIMVASQAVDEAIVQRAHEQRKQQAAALSQAIDRTLEHSENKLQSLEVEIVEQAKPGTTHKERMVETIQVAKPGSKAQARGARKAEEINR